MGEAHGIAKVNATTRHFKEHQMEHKPLEIHKEGQKKGPTTRRQGKESVNISKK